MREKSSRKKESVKAREGEKERGSVHACVHVYVFVYCVHACMYLCMYVYVWGLERKRRTGRMRWKDGRTETKGEKE